MLFSVRITNYQNNLMLNICDAPLLGKKLIENNLKIHISESYYGERLVEKDEAENLLKKTNPTSISATDFFTNTKILNQKNDIVCPKQYKFAQGHNLYLFVSLKVGIKIPYFFENIVHKHLSYYKITFSIRNS